MKLHKYFQALSTVSAQSVTRIIIGNQSADYDSIVGSIVFGYIKLLLFKQLFVPVIDCKRSQLKLRFQVVKLLQHHKLNIEVLKFKQEIDMQKVEDVILYDHNVRGDLNIKPIQIVDHHFMKDKECKKVLVGHCGSCMTLLYYMLRRSELEKGSQWETKFNQYDVSQQLVDVEYDPEIDQLIRVGILLDSYNLSEKQKARWDEIDKRAIENIQKRLKGKELIRFAELQSLKFDESMNLKMKLEDHLVKDFKEFDYGDGNVIGYSIVLMEPSGFLNHYHKETIKKQIEKIMEQRKYCAYFLMFLFEKEGIYRRQLILYGRDNQIWPFLNQILVQKLKMIQVWNENYSVYCQDQTNKISRKVLQKEISIAFESRKNNNEL